MPVGKPPFPRLQRGHPLARGLVLAYPMWERGGGIMHDAVDDSRSQGTIATVPTNVQWIDGDDGAAIYFNGATSGSAESKVTTNFKNAFLDFTCIVWFRPIGSWPAASRIADYLYTSGFWMGTDPAGGAGSTSWGGGIRESGPPYGHYVTIATDGNFHQLAMSRQGTTKTIIADGGKARTSAAVSGTALQTSNPFSLGVETDTNTVHYTGYEKQVLLYNRALSAAEIAQLWLDPYCIYRRHSSALIQYRGAILQSRRDYSLGGF